MWKEGKLEKTGSDLFPISSFPDKISFSDQIIFPSSMMPLGSSFLSSGRRGK